LAQAISGANSVLRSAPSNTYALAISSWSLLGTRQWEAAAEVNSPIGKMYALTYLGRTEEAELLSRELAEKEGDVETYFVFLNLANRSGELVAYLEERWPELDSFQADYPAYGTNGYALMLEVALAYSRTGNTARFDDAMQRLTIVQEFLLAEGVSNQNMYAIEASRLALAGNYPASLEFLQRAMEYGLMSGAEINKEWPALDLLAGDPQFEQLQVQMRERVNAERGKLGLEPLST
jgi:hypothetical protein